MQLLYALSFKQEHKEKKHADSILLLAYPCSRVLGLCLNASPTEHLMIQKSPVLLKCFYLENEIF